MLSSHPSRSYRHRLARCELSGAVARTQHDAEITRSPALASENDLGEAVEAAQQKTFRGAVLASRAFLDDL